MESLNDLRNNLLVTAGMLLVNDEEFIRAAREVLKWQGYYEGGEELNKDEFAAALGRWEMGRPDDLEFPELLLSLLVTMLTHDRQNVGQA